jgi:hypothetical protein
LFSQILATGEHAAIVTNCPVMSKVGSPRRNYWNDTSPTNTSKNKQKSIKQTKQIKEEGYLTSETQPFHTQHHIQINIRNVN